jgi:hypothetical protein
MKKLEEQELKNLQNSINKINSLQLQIGALESQKHEILKMTIDANSELKDLQGGLEKKYGPVSIDISTGEIKENEPDSQN